MTALLVEETSTFNSDYCELEFGDLEYDDSPLSDITGKTEIPSATSTSPTVSSSDSRTISTPHVTSNVSWTPRTFPSPLDIPKTDWGHPWGSRCGPGFGDSRHSYGYGYEDSNYGAGAGADHYSRPRSGFGTGAGYGPYGGEPYYGLGGLGSTNGMAVSILFTCTCRYMMVWVSEWK